MSLLKSLSWGGCSINFSTEFISEPNYISSLYFFSKRGNIYFYCSVKNEKSFVDCLDWSLRILGSFTFLLRSFCRIESALFFTKKWVRSLEYYLNPISFLREYYLSLLTNFCFSFGFRNDILLIFF